MKHDNRLTLAVAGSRKTQSIIDQCREQDPATRTLVLTYTTTNQSELKKRLDQVLGDNQNVQVMGWFSFLIMHWVRPFIPYYFPGRRVRGFDFDTDPQQFKAKTDPRRFLSGNDHVYKVHLPQLAVLVEAASKGTLLSRLSRLYDVIYIDEVQDLGGYDLEVLRLLMGAPLRLRMVGDIRQAILLTNPREAKNKKYQYTGVLEWFKEQEASGRLAIERQSVTWRCHPEVAQFADTIFGARWGFAPTVSRNPITTGHDGVFLVRREHAQAYVDEFNPLCLRHSRAVAKDLNLPFMNIGLSKGIGRKRVLIAPTGKIEKFLTKGIELDGSAAAHFYVAATRAEQSVAIILDKPGDCLLPTWNPNHQA
jgi:DNA helicase II / ATP-dependent DNA helicase PcrA